MIPRAVKIWLLEAGYGEVKDTRAVGGGCINHGAVLTTHSGATFFLKTNAHTPADMFACEVEGLTALRQADGPRAPEPYLHGADFILLEDLSPAARSVDYWEQFGRQLARLHQATNEQFGFETDNYIGSTAQPNPWTTDGYEFFAEQRLLFQARLALKRGLLTEQEVSRVEKLAARLPEIIPAQPASLIHGDLWSGNALTDARGHPALIDPAAHYGWAEAELAMTNLFGAFPESFYYAYQELNPRPPGLWERFPIYNLYHLLNHLNIFGGGYHSQVLQILRRY